MFAKWTCDNTAIDKANLFSLITSVLVSLILFILGYINTFSKFAPITVPYSRFVLFIKWSLDECVQAALKFKPGNNDDIVALVSCIDIFSS